MVSKFLKFLYVVPIFLGVVFTFANNLPVFAAVTADTILNTPGCTRFGDGTVGCIREYNDGGPFRNVYKRTATLLFKEDSTFLGLRDCYYREGSGFGAYETQGGGCGLFALTDRNIGDKFLPAQDERMVDWFTREGKITSGDNANFGVYEAEGKTFIVNPSNGNYIIKSGVTINGNNATFTLTADEKAKLGAISASQIGGSGANLVEATKIDRAKSISEQVKKAGGAGTTCLDPLLSASGQEIIRCFNNGKAIGPDGKALAADCKGYTKSILSIAAGGTTGSAASDVVCLKQDQIDSAKALSANKTANTSIDGKDVNALANTAGDIFQFLFGIIIFILTVILWALNNLLMVAGWLMGTFFVFMLRLNPAGVVQGGSVVFEIWKLLYGVANFLLLCSFIVVGFRQILGVGKSKANVKKFLENTVIIALSLNFTILGAATVVNIAQGVGDIIIYSYVSVTDYGYLPKSGNEAVDNNLKVSTALIGDYLKAVGGASALHCSTTDANNKCDTSKLNPTSGALGFSNYEKAGAVLNKGFGEKMTDFINEGILFLVLIFAIYSVYGQFIWGAITRFIRLVMLIIASPLILAGYLLDDLPGLKNQARNWLDEFVNATIFYPLTVFALIVSGVFINKFSAILEGATATTTSAALNGFVNVFPWLGVVSINAQDGNPDFTNVIQQNSGIFRLIFATILLYLVAKYLVKILSVISQAAANYVENSLAKSETKGGGVDSKEGSKPGVKPNTAGPASALKSLAGKTLGGAARLVGGLATGGGGVVGGLAAGGANLAGKALGGVGGALSSVAGKARRFLAGGTVRNFVDKNTRLTADGRRYVNDSVRNLENFRTMMYNFMTLVDQKGGIRVRLTGGNVPPTGGTARGSSTTSRDYRGPSGLPNRPSQTFKNNDSDDKYKVDMDRANSYQNDSPQFGVTRKLDGPAPVGAIDVKAVTVGEPVISKVGSNSNLSKANFSTSNVGDTRPSPNQAALPPSSSLSAGNGSYAGAQSAYTGTNSQPVNQNSNFKTSNGQSAQPALPTAKSSPTTDSGYTRAQSAYTSQATPSQSSSSTIATPTSSTNNTSPERQTIRPAVGNYANAQKAINQTTQTNQSSDNSGNNTNQDKDSGNSNNQQNPQSPAPSSNTSNMDILSTVTPTITVSEPRVDTSAYRGSYTASEPSQNMKSAQEPTNFSSTKATPEAPIAPPVRNNVTPSVKPQPSPRSTPTDTYQNNLTPAPSSTYQTVEVASAEVPDTLPTNLNQTHLDTSNAANKVVPTSPTLQSRNSNTRYERDTTPTNFVGSRKK